MRSISGRENSLSKGAWELVDMMCSGNNWQIPSEQVWRGGGMAGSAAWMDDNAIHTDKESSSKSIWDRGRDNRVCF